MECRICLYKQENQKGSPLYDCVCACQNELNMRLLFFNPSDTICRFHNTHIKRSRVKVNNLRREKANKTKLNSFRVKGSMWLSAECFVFPSVQGSKKKKMGMASIQLGVHAWVHTLGWNSDTAACCSLCFSISLACYRLFYTQENTHRQTCKRDNQQQLDCSGLEQLLLSETRLRQAQSWCPIGAGREEGEEMERWTERRRSLTQTEESLCWCRASTTDTDWHRHTSYVAGSGKKDTERLWV